MGRFNQLIIGLALCVATIVGMGISGVSGAEAIDKTSLEKRMTQAVYYAAL
jgi:hypothetical protein